MRQSRKTIGVALTALLLMLGLIAPAAAQDQSGEPVSTDQQDEPGAIDPEPREVEWTKSQTCSTGDVKDDYGDTAGNPAPGEGEWTYHFILTNAESWGKIVVSGSPTTYPRSTGGALHIYFNLPKDGTPSVAVMDVVPEVAGASGNEKNVVLTLSHCVDGGEGTPVDEVYDIQLVKVWNVDADLDGLFDEDDATATLAADPASDLSHGDTYTVTESGVDTGHTLCAVTGTSGLGEQTVDGTDAVDGTITHQVTNTVTCQGENTGGTGGTGGQGEDQIETEVGGEIEVVPPETEVRGEIEVVLPETETPMADETDRPQPPANVRALEATPVTEVLGVAQERQLPRTGASTLLLLMLGMLGVGLGATVLRRRTEADII